MQILRREHCNHVGDAIHSIPKADTQVLANFGHVWASNGSELHISKYFSGSFAVTPKLSVSVSPEVTNELREIV